MYNHSKESILFDPIKFVQKMLDLTWRKYNIYKFIYIFLNVLMMTASTISIIWFAVVFYEYGHYTDRFLLLNAGFAASTNLLTALLNMFFIKKMRNKYHDQHWKISAEIVHYRTGTDVYLSKHKHPREHQLFIKVAKIIGIFEIRNMDYYER